jgi:hypothetical protein
MAAAAASASAAGSMPSTETIPLPVDFTEATPDERRRSSREFASFVNKALPLLADRTAQERAVFIEAVVRKWGTNLLITGLQQGLGKLKGPIMTKSVFTSLYLVIARAFGQKQLTTPIAQLFRDLTTEFVEEQSRVLRRHSGKELLVTLSREWERFKIFAEWMRKLFLCVDRADDFDKKTLAVHFDQPHPESLLVTAIGIFRDRLFTSNNSFVTTEVLAVINNHRDGEPLDVSLVRCVSELMLLTSSFATKENAMVLSIRALEELTHDEHISNDHYNDAFVAPICEATRVYYEAKVDPWAASDDLLGLARCIDDALVSEEHMVNQALPRWVLPLLQEATLASTITCRLAALLQHPSCGIGALLADGRDAEVAILFRVVRYIPDSVGLKAFGEELACVIQQYGAAIVAERTARIGKPAYAAPSSLDTHDPGFIESLLGVHDRFSTLLRDACGSNDIVTASFKTAMNSVFNDNADGPSDAHPTSELFAAFFHMVLKGTRDGARLSHDGVIESAKTLTRVFHFLNDKDLFRDSYRSFLARRLLNRTSASFDAEREVIKGFKQTQGSSYVSTIEKMLGDVTTTEKAVAEARTETFDVRLLCFGHWPASFNTEKVQIPPVLKAHVDSFSEMYKRLHSTRRLTFAYAEGRMVLSGFFKTGRYDLDVNTLQGITLLRFNESSRWVISELASAVGLTAEDVCKLLTPLVFKASSRALKNDTLFEAHKAGQKVSKRLKPDHVLSFYPKFTSKRRLTAVADVTLKESFKRSNLDISRKHSIDAAAVRIMKTRQTLRMQELIAQVEAQVARFFIPSPRLVKARIEHLILQDYLERDEDDSNTLQYVA